MERKGNSGIHETVNRRKKKMTTRQKLQTAAKKAAVDMRNLAQILEVASTSTRPTEEIFSALDFAFILYDKIGDAINETFTPLFEERETA